jgi:hypothetical protein
MYESRRISVRANLDLEPGLDIFLAMMPAIFSKYGILPQGRPFKLGMLS